MNNSSPAEGGMSTLERQVLGCLVGIAGLLFLVVLLTTSAVLYGPPDTGTPIASPVTSPAATPQTTPIYLLDP